MKTKLAAALITVAVSAGSAFAAPAIQSDGRDYRTPQSYNSYENVNQLVRWDARANDARYYHRMSDRDLRMQLRDARRDYNTFRRTGDRRAMQAERRITMIQNELQLRGRRF